MTVLEDVTKFVTRLSPEPVCDECIKERLRLAVRQYDIHQTREIAGMNGFERRKQKCSICGTEKLVVLKVPISRRSESN